MKQPCFHYKIIGDILSLYRTFQETFSQYLGIKMRIIQPPKIVVNLLENIPAFQTNGTVIQKFVAFLKLQKFQAIFAPSNSYLTEKSRWVPLCKQRSLGCQRPYSDHIILITESAFVCNNDGDKIDKISCSFCNSRSRLLSCKLGSIIDVFFVVVISVCH